MKFTKPTVVVLAPALEAIQSFLKGVPIFYDMLADPRPSEGAYESDE